MLSLMNEVDLCLLLPLCILYEMQNQFFRQKHELKKLDDIPQGPIVFSDNELKNQLYVGVFLSF